MVTGLSDHTLFSKKLSKNRFVFPLKKTSEQFRIPKSETSNLEAALNEISGSDHLSYGQVDKNCEVLMTMIRETMSQFQKTLRQDHRESIYLVSVMWSVIWA